ncbi:hypothetical protein [Glycomyces artemisiae]|uniref:Uncharacterized protein n=1 Tax=Glycomyces artemisiae TaxID=1076443 RepID=A0A2T0UHK4_9ACTN|nr:hypothetical protein [Glycomyces artemisiae]PRY57317.1 hypothetical protein B0I28_107165 [Glycomyces artemisiae]
MAKRAAHEQVTIRNPIERASWAWAGIGLVIAVGTVLWMIAAGGETIMVRDRYVWMSETEAYAWQPPLYLGLALLGYPLVRSLMLLRPLPAARLDPAGITLLDGAKVRAKWAEVDRIVLWRQRAKRFGVESWAPRIGIVRRSERTDNFRKAAEARHWTAADLRDNGVPAWLPGGIHKCSARLHPARAGALAAAVARFAPDLQVVDEREPDRRAPVPPA